MNRTCPTSAGFTLVELMIALTLALILTSGLLLMFANSSRVSADIDNAARQMENGRYAVEILRNDIRLAGFYGEYSPSGVDLQLPDPCASAVASLGWNSAGMQVPVAITGYEASDPAVSGLGCLSNRKAGTDVFIVRRVSSTPLTAAGAITNRVYFQTSLCAIDPPSTQFVVAAAPSAAFNLHQSNCTTAASLRQYFVHIYYVSACDVCGSDTTPTLKRVELGAGSMSTLPLVQGVEDFRVEYGIDNAPATGDGDPDLYRKCSVADACAIATDWANVMAVRLYVLARNVNTTTGYRDTKTYDLGLSGVVGPFNDGYQRHLYTTDARAVNPAGRREVP